LIGPPIVLAAGQPVDIEVVNRIKEPTAIHWHGIEIESYYDGVPDWAGTAQQPASAVQPGKSFVARMTPPHAGTFIYHTHWHDESQLTNGIYGPLIVLPPGKRFETAVDKIFVIGVGNYEPFGEALVVNGYPQPPVMPLQVGTKYRLRLINITPDSTGMQIRLMRAGVPVEWRSVAKDGAELPPAQAVVQKADFLTTVGETFDFEYAAAKAEELTLEIYSPDPKLRTTQTLIFGAQ
jgi:FtsP/CotA-like multicopper oxidase with cupredoxin domain